MAKKHLRDIPKGSMAARSAAAKRNAPKAVEPEGEPTKWVTRHSYEGLHGKGEKMPYSGEFKPVKGDTRPPPSMLQRINPTWAMLGAAAGAAVVLAMIQARAMTPMHQTA